MKTKKIDLRIEHCGRDHRVYDAVVVNAKHHGRDRLGEFMVSLVFQVHRSDGKSALVTKRYFGPFTKKSALVRDLNRIAGPDVIDGSVFDLGAAINKRCRVKVVPGLRIDTLYVLDPEEEER